MAKNNKEEVWKRISNPNWNKPPERFTSDSLADIMARDMASEIDQKLLAEIYQAAKSDK